MTIALELQQLKKTYPGGDDEGVLVREIHTPCVLGAEGDGYLGVSGRT